MEVLSETADTSTFTVRFSEEDRRNSFSFQPGQFNMLSIFGVGEAPISISSDPGAAATFSHTIRHVGSLTKMSSKLKAGDLLGVRGPYGNGWPIEQAKGKNLLIVAGGIGLAPLRPVIATILNNRPDFADVEILYGAKNPGELLFRGQLADWQKEIKVHLTVDNPDDAWQQHTGVVTKLFAVMNSKPAETLVLACGPELMMKFVAEGLCEQGFDEKQIFISLERKMHCGIKKCGRCLIGEHFVCQDGPVFPYSIIANQSPKIVGVLGRGV